MYWNHNYLLLMYNNFHMNLKPNQLFLVGKYKGQARYFDTNELREILNALIDLDANYKVGLISLEIGIEAILCRYCSK